MSKHLKRHKVPKSWPIPRKGTKYLISSNTHSRQGLPLLIVLRDMLKIAQNRKEVKKAIHSKNILLNGKAVKDDKAGTTLFDVVTIVPSKKSYSITLGEKGKFELAEVKDAGKKVAKIVDKTSLKGKKTQLNLSDGRNFLFDSPAKVGDSVLIDFAKKSIGKVLEMKAGANALVFAGKHTGKIGKIDKVKEERKMVGLTYEKEKINVLIKQMMVIE
jgi:small subunit ribosomal protein S4e